MRNYISFLALSLFFISCEVQQGPRSEKNRVNSEADALANAEAPAGAYKMNGNVQNTAKDLEYEKRKLIWKANLVFKVKDVDQATDRIGDLCNRFDANISDMEMKSEYNQVENTIQIRVANSKFHKLVTELKGQAIYMDKAQINSNDVTEEFVDIESRLNSKKEVRDRYIEILRKRTGTIEDVLNAEEKIRVITEEIEAKEGRLRYLRDQVNFSTISMRIYHKVEGEPTPKPEEITYADELGDSFGSGWREVKQFFLAIISIWPLILLLTTIGIWQRKRIQGLIQGIRK